MKKYIYSIIIAGLLVLTGCNSAFLDENPKGFLVDKNVLVNSRGFQTYTNGIYSVVRQEFQTFNGTNTLIAQGACGYEVLQTGLDVCTSSIQDATLNKHTNYTFNNTDGYVVNKWKWSYYVIGNCNVLINAAENSGVRWDNTKDKELYQAHARFFRAYAYRSLVYLYGDVPWVTVSDAENPRDDFPRTPRMEVVGHMIEDLEFAALHLPTSGPNGELTKWAALHLLSEMCNFNGTYDRAASAALEVINSGQFKLMDARFGGYTSKPGDAFSDMFMLDNSNPSNGNLESIFVIQSEYETTGGSDSSTDWTRRAWVPSLFNIVGFVISEEYGGRGLGQIHPLDSWLNSFEAGDMRNSPYNVRRDFYYNDPKSPLFGQLHVITADNIYRGQCNATITKFDYMAPNNPTFNGNMKDKIRFRLGETYLLLAEAYINKGDIANATAAINKVRARANTTAAVTSEVDMDYLLDERARELLGEEMRRFTLIRTGKLLERTRKMNTVSGPLIKDYMVLWPIPQDVIDGNAGLKWENNPGWN